MLRDHVILDGCGTLVLIAVPRILHGSDHSEVHHHIQMEAGMTHLVPYQECSTTALHVWLCPPPILYSRQIVGLHRGE